MKINNLNIKEKFLGKWILAISIAWPVGGILAIILSYAVVNLFYPEETNLIVGLVIGGAVGFAQWFILKKTFKVNGWWIVASAIGFGLPIILVVIWFEMLGHESGLIENEILNRVLIGALGGMLVGLLQIIILKPLSNKALWWIVINILAWGISSGLTGIGPVNGMLFSLLGGVVLGAITGVGILWLLKFPLEK